LVVAVGVLELEGVVKSTLQCEPVLRCFLAPVMGLRDLDFFASSLFLSQPTALEMKARLFGWARTPEG
jgi:hypothetical protein